MVLIAVPSSDDFSTREPIRQDRDNLGTLYTLSCPDSGAVRYVGCTIYNDARARLSGHFQRGSNMQTPVSLWVEQLAMEMRRPTFATHGQMPYGDACRIELDWIRTFSKHLRGVLLNVTGRADVNNKTAGRWLREQLAIERPLPPGYAPCPKRGVRYFPSGRVVHATRL